jgi:hypothetical protein
MEWMDLKEYSGVENTLGLAYSQVSMYKWMQLRLKITPYKC